MTKKSRQKFQYLENKKSFKDEIKSIFKHFWRAFIEANKTNFLGRWKPDLKLTEGFPGKLSGSKLKEETIWFQCPWKVMSLSFRHRNLAAKWSEKLKSTKVCSDGERTRRLDRVFCKIKSLSLINFCITLRGRIQNLVKHLRRSFSYK